MAKRDVHLVEFTCDGCEKSFLVNEDEELPLGFHGHAFWVHGGGGDYRKWYACNERCLRKAVVNAFTREYDEALDA